MSCLSLFVVCLRRVGRSRRYTASQPLHLYPLPNGGAELRATAHAAHTAHARPFACTRLPTPVLDSQSHAVCVCVCALRCGTACAVRQEATFTGIFSTLASQKGMQKSHAVRSSHALFSRAAHRARVRSRPRHRGCVLLDAACCCCVMCTRRARED